MQPRNIQSVHGYLAPQRILSSLMNSSKKQKINRSLTIEQINYDNGQEKSLAAGTTPRQDQKSRRPIDDAPSPRDDSNFVLYPDEQLSSSDEKKNSKVSKVSNNNDNIDFIRIYDERNGNSSKVSRSSLHQKKKEEQQSNEEQFQYAPSSKKDHSEGSSHEVVSRRFHTSNKPKSEIERLAIEETLKQLISVKNELEEEIGALKALLDDTSASLQDMDHEFHIIKQKILTFTSQALDSSFREYKKNLPNWSVYEQIEEKGVSKLTEINQCIELCESYQKLKSAGGKQSMEKNLPNFKAAARQIKQARQQCQSHRPMLSQETIQRLQGILRQIGQF